MKDKTGAEVCHFANHATFKQTGIIKNMSKTGILYVVAIPIGHPKDITLRALEVLQQVDGVICEDLRNAKRLFHQQGLLEKPFYLLNEHNEGEQAPLLIALLQSGKNLALISDCGTPVFSDPGALLLQHAVQSDITIKPIPGPSSLMAALSVLDLPLNQFVFGGFLPRKPQERHQALQRLKAMRLPIILMDAPYRLLPVLENVEHIFGSGVKVTLALDLTLPEETILRGEVHRVIQTLPRKKGEFVLIVHTP